MELALSAKRKLGYVTGTVLKPTTNEAKQDAWMVSNSLVISWILQNVSERIRRLVMFIETAKKIWETLNKRYSVANGVRKLKLNKDSYEIAQDNRPIEEYYTQLQIVWDELENMNNYPKITKMTSEITTYVQAVNKQTEERRLSLFLNGLDKDYKVLRSNILLMSPLPPVDTTFSILLQEEA
ncbi:uncharacterized protein LOC141590457 [Silene latifolia]|uniref:uncharacterized protein LOC141590457 n=1 Tax=Silene latifolia TaxID=37657 RepID=UPI003D77E0CF